MAEHVCKFEGKYKPNDFLGRLAYGLCECGETLTLAELCKRANATEKLNASQAQDAASNSECHMQDRCVYEKEFKEVQATIDALQAYADIRDGNDAKTQT